MLHPATANDYMMQQAVLGGIWNEIKTGFNDNFLHGDADSKGKYAGTAIWTAITLFNPEGKIGDLGKVDKVIDVADKADEGEKLIKDGEYVTKVTGEATWKKVSRELTEKAMDVSSWCKGSFDSAQDSLAYHFEKHASEVGATSGTMSRKSTN